MDRKTARKLASVEIASMDIAELNHAKAEASASTRRFLEALAKLDAVLECAALDEVERLDIAERASHDRAGN